ncbi:hypothetical protein LWI28_006776 [Acer negundo]|uniref:Uncharacterized protein n=1 Tax=Acer negundo TaxID=4023 RepID=A0AAD5IPC9_ACENE|nr:hypothetical protein LWI28_006776 [Acer negundo]
MGMAIHPNFAKKGQFFTSFNCDKVKWPGCAGRCLCNSDVNCDPSKLGVDNSAQPCQYQTVTAEHTANVTASEPSLAKSAKPSEVRRIFTMGLPFTVHLHSATPCKEAILHLWVTFSRLGRTTTRISLSLLVEGVYRVVRPSCCNYTCSRNCHTCKLNSFNRSQFIKPFESRV